MESACIVCLESSPGMYTIDSKSKRKSDLSSLLTRFGGLTISTGKICQADRKSLLHLTSIADKFYNKCQKSLMKRLRLADKNQTNQDKTIKQENRRECSGRTDIDEKEIEKGAEFKQAENDVVVKTEASELISIEQEFINSTIDKKSADKHDSDTDIDYWESQDSDTEAPRKKRLAKSRNKSPVVAKRSVGRPKRKKTAERGGSSVERSGNTVERISVKLLKKNKNLNVKKSRKGDDRRRIVTRNITPAVKVKEESSDAEDSDKDEGAFTIVELNEELSGVKKEDSGETDTDEKPSIGVKKKGRIRKFESGICYLCGTVFNSRSGFQAHMKSHKTGVGSGHKCELCEKQYTRLSYLKLHMRREHSDVKLPVSSNGTVSNDDTGPKDLPCFICHQCGKCLTSRGKLKYHMEGHSVGGAIKPHGCTLCEKRFRQANALKIHMRRHTGELPFHCSLCEGRFTDAYSLRRHQQYNHSPGSSVPCSECNRHFASPDELAEHMPIHNRAKAYQCPVCSRGFRNRSNLSKHKKIHTGIKSCVCTQCPAKFRTMTHLKRHVNMVHNEVKPYQCPVCNGRFTSSQSLKRHGWLHTQAWKEKRELVLIPPVTDVSMWMTPNKTETSSPSSTAEVTSVVSAVSESSPMMSSSLVSSLSLDTKPVLSSMINVPMMMVSSAMPPVQSPITLTMPNRNPVPDGGIMQNLGASYNPAMRSMFGLSQAAAVMSAIESSSSLPLSLSTFSSGLPLQAFQPSAVPLSLSAVSDASTSSLMLVPMVTGDTKLLQGMRLDNMPPPLSTPVSPPGAIALLTKAPVSISSDNRMHDIM